MAEPLFDTEQFLKSLAQDKELAAELLAAFFEDSPARVNSLTEAVAAKDMTETAKLSHSLKGMCGVVRTPALVHLALAMETAAKDDDFERVSVLFPRFKETLDKAHVEMRAFLDQE